MNEGWVCPKCGRVLAPNTMYCLWCCSERGATTNTASGTPESYLAKSLRYSRDSHEIAKDEPQTEADCNKCLGKYCSFSECPMETEPQTETKTETQNSNLTFEKADEPQRDDIGNCNICKYVGLEHRCNQCVNGSMFYKDEPQTDAVGVPMAFIDEAKFKAHCLNCQRDVADIKCLDCDGDKYFLPDEPQTERSE